VDDDFTFDDKSSIANSSCVVSVIQRVCMFLCSYSVCVTSCVTLLRLKSCFFNERYLHVVNKLFKLAILSVAILGHVTVH